jgi:hypothetical protein
MDSLQHVVADNHLHMRAHKAPQTMMDPTTMPTSFPLAASRTIVANIASTSTGIAAENHHVAKHYTKPTGSGLAFSSAAERPAPETIGAITHPSARICCRIKHQLKGVVPFWAALLALEQRRGNHRRPTHPAIHWPLHGQEETSATFGGMGRSRCYKYRWQLR